MIHYHVQYENPTHQFLKLSCTFELQNESQTIFHLPQWRPGRYQITTFAANIRNFKAVNENGQPLAVQKTSTSSWQIDHPKAKTININYEYYASTLDAGSTYMNEGICYVNPINCLVYSLNTVQEPCCLSLHVPDNFHTRTGLTSNGKNQFLAQDYYELIDSPILSSSILTTEEFSVNDKKFYLHIHGDFPVATEVWKKDFAAYTMEQVNMMQGFPCSEYHYLILALPYKHYHGVEHRNSTVICIGPSEDLKHRTLYKEFLGVCSHELFHTWNVIRMRPAEMTPYRLQEENYHETGFITEGITTFYGDFFLARSGVFNPEEYLIEMNELLRKHYRNEGRNHYSVAQSSFDLWVDGYVKGIPGRKVSIYNEGALLALILDLKIRVRWKHKRSLDDVMRALWKAFGTGKSGYSYQDYQRIAEEVYGDSLLVYFEHYVSGTKPYEEVLFPLLSEVGLSLQLKDADLPEEKYFGLRLSAQNNFIEVSDIAANSSAAQVLSLKDRLIDTNTDFKKNPCIIEIERMGTRKKITLERRGETYFSVYQAKIDDSTLLNRWLRS